MKKIQLDPRKLLGFKIIASDESPAKLRSPKIGDKGCQVMDDTSSAIVTAAPGAAKIDREA